MTKKDYVRIAAALKSARSEYPSACNSHAQSDEDARALADALALDNPKFDRARFLAACGVQS